MKFTYVFALAAAATVVSAETNAQRMARGLPPKGPARRGTPSFGAKRGSPSGTPSGGSQCNTGPVQCCNSVQQCGSGNEVDTMLSLLGLSVPAGTNVGTNCSPISAVGTGSGASCTQQPVCCENNNFNGLVNIGCTPININL